MRIFYPDKELHDQVIRSIQAGDGAFCEYPVRVRDGSIRYQMWSNFSLQDRGECLSFGYDITEQKRLEEERGRLLATEKRLRQDAEEASRLRDEFLSIASHELRTPLTTLSLQLQLLKRLMNQDKLVELNVEQLATIIRMGDQQVERLSRLVDGLLDVTRIGNGQLNLIIQEVDLAEVAQDVAKRFRTDASSANCEIQLSAENGISGSWDRLRIEQVVTNLLSNAIKYGRDQTIQIRVWGDENVARLSVQDHGIGISKEDQSRIFGLFERAVSLRNFGGLGVGLYITQQIVKAHRGKIEVDSDNGRGTVFTVELPRRLD